MYGLQTITLIVTFLDGCIQEELDFVVLSKLVDVCYKVVQISGDAIPDLVNELKQFFMNLLLFSSEKSGWESISGESHLSALLRGEVLVALSTFGHDNTHKEAIRRFQAFVDDRNTPHLSADTKRASYIAVMMNTSTTNRNGFQSLLNVYKEANTVQEKERVLCSIASCPDPDIVLEVLNFMLCDEVRDQDATYVLAGISSKGGEVAWRWLKENWELISTKYGGDGMLIQHLIRDVITLFCSNEKADEIEAFFESRKRPSFDMNLRQSIEQVRIKARWVENIRREQSLRDQIKHLAHKK